MDLQENDVSIPEELQEPIQEVTQEPLVIWKMESDDIKIKMYDNGKLLILYKPTCHTRFDSGIGPRENTANLYSLIELTPRPAKGTQVLCDPHAVTQLYNEN